jgi:hypothetical protein
LPHLIRRAEARRGRAAKAIVVRAEYFILVRDLVIRDEVRTVRYWWKRVSGGLFKIYETEGLFCRSVTLFHGGLETATRDSYTSPSPPVGDLI